MAAVFKDGSDFLRDKKKLGLEFFHVATGHSVNFKAFLTSYSDQFTSDWSSEKVYGRMDPIHTFQGTARVITLGWDVPAADFAEAELNFSNASKMYAMLYPAFRPDASAEDGSTGVMSAPPLIKLKFGNLIYDASTDFNGTASDSGLLGWLADLSFAPDLEAGFFDEKPNFLIPQTIKLTCTFNVLHTHPLGWDLASPSDGARPLRKQKQNFPYDLAVGAEQKIDTQTAKVGPQSPVPTDTSDIEDPDLLAQVRRDKLNKLNKRNISKRKTEDALS